MNTEYNARIQVRLPAELKGEVESYAKRNHIKISHLVVRLLYDLIKVDNELGNPVDAEQI